MERHIRNNDRETVEKTMRKLTTLIDNRPILKALKHKRGKKLVKDMNRLGKALPKERD